MDRSPGQLGDSVFGISLPSAGESYRFVRVDGAAAKILQECITLFVFTVVAFVLFGSPVRWNYFASYALIVGAIFLAFKY